MSRKPTFTELLESVIDSPQQTLSPHVFRLVRRPNKRLTYELLPRVRLKILHGWGQIAKIAPTGRVLLVGGITTFNYSPDSDIDANIQILDPKQLTAARALLPRLNGKRIGPHELNYFVLSEIPWSNHDSIYDVLQNRWLRGPSEVSVDLERYWQRFLSVVESIDEDKAELLSDLAEFIQLRHLNVAHRQQLRSRTLAQLNTIAQDLEQLTDKYHEIINARREAFENPSLEEIRQYRRKTALPENVIYLLLRRYCYLNLLHELDKFELPLHTTDVAIIQHDLNKFNHCKHKQFTTTLESALPESLRDEDEFRDPYLVRILLAYYQPAKANARSFGSPQATSEWAASWPPIQRLCAELPELRSLLYADDLESILFGEPASSICQQWSENRMLGFFLGDRQLLRARNKWMHTHQLEAVCYFIHYHGYWQPDLQNKLQQIGPNEFYELSLLALG